jgi:PAS domain S-box-containing protein
MGEDKRTTKQLLEELAELRWKNQELQATETRQQRLVDAWRDLWAQYEAIIEAFDGLIYICSQNYEVEFMNQAFIRRTGYYPLGQKCYEALHNRADICPWCVNEVVFQGETVRWEVLSPKDNHWYHVVNTPIIHQDGTISKMALIQDITQRKHAEEQIRRQSAVLASINTVFHQALTCETEAELGRTCLSVAERLTGSQSGWIGFVNEAGRLDTLALSDPGWIACSLPQSEIPCLINNMEIRGIWGRVLQDGASLFVNDPASHPDWRGLPGGHPPLHAFLGVPLKHRGITTGMISLANKESGYTLADQKDVESLSLAIVEALMRKRAEEALKESEENYRTLVENVNVGVYRNIGGPEGRFIKANPAMVRMFGYGSVDEFLQINVADLYQNPKEREYVVQEIARKGQVKNKELRLKKKDGAPLWASVSAQALYHPDGQIKCIDGVIEDITERKRAEASLRRATRALKTLSACHAALVRAAKETAFLKAICRIIVELGGYRLAWVGLAQQDEARTVLPVAQAGYEKGYLKTVNITWSDTERGRGPTGTAIRTGKTCIINDILNDPRFEPWRAGAQRRRYASSISLPLLTDGRIIGALNIYAKEPDAFDAEEVQLLEELADAVAFGILTLRRRAAGRQDASPE